MASVALLSSCELTFCLFPCEQKYPIVWQGLLALKNDTAAVQLHFVSGNNVLAHRSLPLSEGGPPLRIAQRMRLEATQLEGVARRMTVGLGPAPSTGRRVWAAMYLCPGLSWGAVMASLEQTKRGMFCHPWECKMPSDPETRLFSFQQAMRVGFKVVSEAGAFVDLGAKFPGLDMPLFAWAAVLWGRGPDR